VARLRRTPWVFDLRDLWPASIAAVGVMNGRSAPMRWLERLELALYREAAAVACVTRSFVAELAARGIDVRKLHFLPNGVIPEFWAAGTRDETRRELNLSPDAVLVSYIGTTGMAHGLRAVLDAAVRLEATAPAVQLLIAGDGAELVPLRTAAAERRLRNVRFAGLVPRARIPSLLAASDIMLVTLRPAAVFTTVLPSKMFEAMAAARPIVLGVEGEARETLHAANAGIAVPPGDSRAIADAVCLLAGDRALREAMGASGRQFVQREFSRRSWAARYLAVLENVARPAAAPVASRETVTTR
jgi:glycosyltransferase involved in cell wall biosynthesis